MGKEGAGLAPKLKLGPPRTIFLAPALYIQHTSKIFSARR